MNWLSKWKSHLPAVDMDIFKVSTVQNIHIHYGTPNRIGMFSGTRMKESCSATICFKQGNTTGTHEIEGDTIPDILPKIEAFLRSIDEGSVS